MIYPPASEKNDENLVIIAGHKKLAFAYATYVMSVYQHYRFRSYVREALAKVDRNLYADSHQSPPYVRPTRFRPLTGRRTPGLEILPFPAPRQTGC